VSWYSLFMPRAPRYTCWECHKSGFKEDDLIGHRCDECRENRVRSAKKGGRFSPYVVKGQMVWKKTGKGSRGRGFTWERRKQPISADMAQKRLDRLRKTLVTS
jgi:hypothetical protein